MTSCPDEGWAAFSAASLEVSDVSSGRGDDPSVRPTKGPDPPAPRLTGCPPQVLGVGRAIGLH